jgi:poly(hydroxyalkanoate) depolymerase family esterase
LARSGLKLFGSRALQRSFISLARVAIRASGKAVAKALSSAKTKRTARPVAKPVAQRVRPKQEFQTQTTAVWTSGLSGTRRYRLCKPPGSKSTERLPLLVMLHGCAQDAQALASVSQMNQVAARENFLVLYPEQGRASNLQGCWNWFATRSGQAQGEAEAIASMIEQVSRLQPVDPNRVALAGLSAGASMAALLATRHPQRYRAVAMHSGVAPGVAQSQAGALSAMRGRGTTAATPLSSGMDGVPLPPLLVIHGSADTVVVPANAVNAAQRWAACEDARATAPRTLQRGARYAVTITDYLKQRRVVVSHCLINGLGHAWSGGATHMAFSDPKGPNASRMIWAFANRQFAGNS